MRYPTLTAEERALRAAAYRAVNRALRAGTLVRPEACDNCHGGRPDAHHHEGYEPAHQLDVIWLCDMCHATLHASGRCPRPMPEHVREAVRAMVAAGQIIDEWKATS